MSFPVDGKDYLVPPEFVRTMRASMLDKCPVQTYKQVCDVFLAEFGQFPHEVNLPNESAY